MAGYRITKILCACCKGKPEDSLLGFCMWCSDSKRMSADDAAHYASNLWFIAGGGYIAGDHDLDDMRRMEAEAAAVFALIERPVPWSKKTGRAA